MQNGMDQTVDHSWNMVQKINKRWNTRTACMPNTASEWHEDWLLKCLLLRQSSWVVVDTEIFKVNLSRIQQKEGKPKKEQQRCQLHKQLHHRQQVLDSGTDMQSVARVIHSNLGTLALTCSLWHVIHSNPGTLALTCNLWHVSYTLNLGHHGLCFH